MNSNKSAKSATIKLDKLALLEQKSAAAPTRKDVTGADLSSKRNLRNVINEQKTHDTEKPGKKTV
jgi:hypothetical protein